MIKKFVNNNLKVLVKIQKLCKENGFAYYSEIEIYLNRGRNQVSSVLGRLELNRLIRREIEDPATGSGNGCLAAYLVNHQYYGKNSVDVRVEQGYEVGRPSLLLLKADEIEGKISVSVGGKAFIIAKGELF